MKEFDGCGVGLRASFLKDIFKYRLDFIEITPENWMDMPICYREDFEKALTSFPTIAHGLSLSIGSFEPLDFRYLKKLKKFLDRYKIAHYSEHLAFTSLEKRFSYELLPIPMSKRAAKSVAKKLKIASEYLEREIILENPTYYALPYSPKDVKNSYMEEYDFINMILEKSGMRLLFDINNLFVNSKNHSFCPLEFFKKIEKDKIAYYHIAGHLKQKDKPIIDTHGMPICQEGWNLIEKILRLKKAPILLERDNNIPPLSQLISEIDRARAILEAKNE